MRRTLSLRPSREFVPHIQAFLKKLEGVKRVIVWISGRYLNPGVYIFLETRVYFSVPSLRLPKICGKSARSTQRSMFNVRLLILLARSETDGVAGIKISPACLHEALRVRRRLRADTDCETGLSLGYVGTYWIQ